MKPSVEAKPVPSTSSAQPSTSTAGVVVPAGPVPSTSSAPAPIKPKDTSASLAALFEKDTNVPGFGMGGLLGLRKMPSFRVRFRSNVVNVNVILF